MGMKLVLHNTTCAMPAISVRLAVLDTIVLSLILGFCKLKSRFLKDICCMVTFDNE